LFEKEKKVVGVLLPPILAGNGVCFLEFCRYVEAQFSKERVDVI